jgi:hypothetical protein
MYRRRKGKKVKDRVRKVPKIYCNGLSGIFNAQDRILLKNREATSSKF